jgi:uncharacterized protein YecT (DUF1311 family)
MRWACLSLVLLLCTGCSVLGSSSDEERATPSAAQASNLGPPVISEAFTLLPCPAKPKSTLDFEGCDQHEIREGDKAINLVARDIYRRLGTRTAQARFVRAEIAWVTYRRAACASRKDLFEGGSASILVFGDCVVAQNRAHLKELKAFDRRLRWKSRL